MLLRLVIFFTATLLSGAFVARGPRTSTWTVVPRAKSPLVVHAVERTPFELEVPLGSDSRAQLKFKPLLDNSEVLVVKYPIPFGLSVEPKDGNAVVTADGQDGGEKVGDVLRFTTHWFMGQIEGSGLLSTVGNFGGAPSWKLGLFDVAKATRWEDVVEALVSNEPRRGTDSVTLIFERPLKD